MHPELERERFINHLTKLQQEIERLAMVPARDQTYLATLKAKLERSEAQNAVLRARLTSVTEPRKSKAPPGEVRQGCRYPNTALGSLTYEQALEMHLRQLDPVAIAAAAGVNHSTLSRWRKANGYVLVWTQRAASGSSEGASGLSDALTRG